MVAPTALIFLLPPAADDVVLTVPGPVALIGVIALIVLNVWRATNGRPGPSRFGQNPKEEAAGPAVA